MMTADITSLHNHNLNSRNLKCKMSYSLDALVLSEGGMAQLSAVVNTNHYHCTIYNTYIYNYIYTHIYIHI